MPTFEIRKMTVEDVSAVFAIEDRTFTTPWSERMFKHELQRNPSSRIWVLEVLEEGEKIIAGMVVAWLIVDEVHIANIAIDAPYRRQGLGCKLLKHALLQGLADGGKLSYLEVRAGNEGAIRMYERFGYYRAGLRVGYYKDNNEDGVLMTLDSIDPEALNEIC